MNAEPHRDQFDRAVHFGPDTRREMPSNVEAEQALLGAILVNNAAYGALPDGFESKHLYEPLHRSILDACAEVIGAGKTANPVTIKPMIPSGMVGDLTTIQYVAKICTEAVSIVNVPDYADGIILAARRRALVSLGESAVDVGFDCVNELLFLEQMEAIRNQMDRIIRGLEGDDEQTLADAAERALDATCEAYKGHGVVGVDYGFAPLMNMIGPALPGQLIVVGGGTKQGKSTLLEQLVMGAAVNAHPVWIYSGEMKGEELAQRALSRLTDIQAWRQARGKVTDAEYEKLETARRNAETWQRRVVLKDKPMTLAQIERSVETFTKRHPGGMAVIDHIGLVERDKATARMEDHEFGPVVTRAAKMLANKAGLPIIAAAQLKKNTFVVDSRRLERKAFMEAINRRPRFTDLIGACERDANHVILPFRPEPILEEMRPSESADAFSIWEEVSATVKDKAEIILALSRHTRWPQRKEVGWDGGKTMFTDPQEQGQGRMF